MQSPNILSGLEEVSDDIRANRILAGILILTIILCGFWFWYRTPNFATSDEYSRLIDPMKAAGAFLGDPSLQSLSNGSLDGRALGATFYLYGFTLLPIFVCILLTGQLGAFTSLGGLTSRWTLWFSTPAWFWTASILLGRLVVVAFAVGCVYLMYKLGEEFVNETTGHLSAILLTLSFGFVSSAHEIGEDIPMLFFFLLSILLLVRYIHSGEKHLFFLASIFGGIAIALKLTAGTIVFAIGVAWVLRVYQSPNDVKQSLIEMCGGLVIGILVIYVGIPSVLFGGPDRLVARAFGAGAEKILAETAHTIWYRILQGYLQGLGLPLTVAVVAGFISGALKLRKATFPGLVSRVILIVPLLVYIVVFIQWGYVRVHHLLPTFPLLILLFGLETTTRFNLGRNDMLSGALAILLLTSGVYTAVGIGSYTTDPRDSASEWLATNADENATVEVYENSIADVGVPHSLSVNRYDYNEDTKQPYAGSLVQNESAYTEWMLSMPDRQPEYIQLTAAELAYLSERGEEYPDRRQYIQDLLNENYDYEVVAEYSSKQDKTDPSKIILYPRGEQIEEKVIILRRVDEG